MDMIRKPCFAFLLLFVISGFCSCADLFAVKPTGYYAWGSGNPGGYNEARIGERMYKVNYRCSSVTSESECDGYLIRRCAELTFNAGYDYFVMEDHRVRSVGLQSHVIGDKNSPGYVETSKMPYCLVTIVMHKGAKPSDKKDAYTPDEILRKFEK